VSEAEADAVLHGVVVKYEKGPLTFDRAQTVDEFKVEITVAVQLEDLREGRVLWKEDQFRAWKSYKEAVGGTGEDDAVNAAIATLASDILSRTLEGW
jgi:Lipopolysaccharide-assembly